MSVDKRIMLWMLLLPVLCWADAGVLVRQDARSVMLVLVEGGGYDAFNDAALSAVYESYPEFTSDQVCWVKTRYLYNNQNYPECTLWDVMSPFIDTDADYVPDAGVNSTITAGDDYLFSRCAECQRLAQSNNNVVDKFVFGKGFPRYIRSNPSPPFDDDPNTNPTVVDSIVAKSMCHAFEIYYHPGIDTFWNDKLKLTGNWGSRYAEAARNSAKKGFVPGVYWNYRATGTGNDSTKQYVFATMLAGETPQEMGDLIRRAAQWSGRVISESGTSDYWAVVDAEIDPSDGYLAPFYGGKNVNSVIDTASFLYYDCRGVFGSNMLFDLSVPLITLRDTPDDTLFATEGGIPDCTDVFFGYNGGQTLAAGDSALFYWSPGAYHVGYNAGGVPANVPCLTTLRMAPMAWVYTKNSFNVYSLNTAYKNGGTWKHPLGVEYLSCLGATFFVGNGREVATGVTAADYDFIVESMATPFYPFGYAQALCFWQKSQGIALGWPLGYWRGGAEATGFAVTYAGRCNEVLSFAGVAPANADSVRFTLDKLTGADYDTVFDVAGSAVVNFAIGEKWKSVGNVPSSSYVTWIATDGTRTTYQLTGD